MANTCPKCNSERVRRSHRKGALERILSFFGLGPRRCHDCNVRFLTIGKSMLYRSDVDVLLRNVIVVVMAGIALLAIVMVVLWLSRSQTPPSSSLFLPAINPQSSLL
jgi:hypothetical protein